MGQFDQVLAICLCHRAGVDDADFLSKLGVYILGDPLAKVLMSLLSLISRCDAASSHGPNGFVSEHNMLPVALEDLSIGFELLI